MEFLKKHYEKVTLAVALLALIVSAAVLVFKINDLRSEVTAGSHAPPRKGPAVTPIDLGPYTNAQAALNSPLLWEKSSQDLFGVVRAPVIETKIETQKGPQIVLVNVVRKPFKLLFKAYSWDDKTKAGYNIQLNFRSFSHTFFVAKVGDYVRDRFEDTGYKITKFDRIVREVADPQLGRKVEKDFSELTLVHEDEKPIVLSLGKETEEQEPVALYRCGSDAPTYEVRRGQRFICAAHTYNVVDIKPTQMIIKDAQLGESYTIELTAGRE